VEGRPFRLAIEYSLENPQGGMHFVVPEESSPLEVQNNTKITMYVYLKTF